MRFQKISILVLNIDFLNLSMDKNKTEFSQRPRDLLQEFFHTIVDKVAQSKTKCDIHISEKSKSC